MNSSQEPSNEPERPAIQQRSWLGAYWEKVGGGSLTISLVLHGGLILLALFWFISSKMTAPSETVDFLAGGGGGQGGETKMQEKRRQRAVRQDTPSMRIVSNSTSTDAVSLPDVTSTMNLSQMATNPVMGGAMGAGSGVGSGGGRGSGTGTGVGSGFGPGSGGGFISVPSIFGSMGTGGLTGTLYDMKQDREGKPLSYDASVAAFFPKLYEIADKRFRKDAFNGFYQAKVTLAYTMLAVPNVPAEEGPKAFQADKEIQPRGWFLHYHGKIDPPEEGDWRFAGIFDDALLVYVNNRLVFDGSWDSQAKKDVREDFGTGVFAGSGRTPYVGSWVKLKRGSTLDILVGERPGGRVGGVLLVQQKSKKYKEREKDIPILPVFSFNAPRKEDRERIDKIGFPIAEETPVFRVNNDKFTSSLGGDRD